MRHAISFRPPPSPRYTLSTPSVLPAVRAQTMRHVNGHCPPRSNMLLGCSVDTHGVHARRPQTRQEPGGSVGRAVRGRDLPAPCRRLSSHICIIHTCMHTSAAARLQSPVAPPCFWGSNQPQKPPSPALHHPQNGVQPGEEAEGGRRGEEREGRGARHMTRRRPPSSNRHPRPSAMHKCAPHSQLQAICAARTTFLFFARARPPLLLLGLRSTATCPTRSLGAGAGGKGGEARGARPRANQKRSLKQAARSLRSPARRRLQRCSHCK